MPAPLPWTVRPGRLMLAPTRAIPSILALMITLMTAGCATSAGGSSDQLAQLRAHNAQLRQEVDQLRKKLGLPPRDTSADPTGASTITSTGQLIQTHRVVFELQFDSEANLTSLTSKRFILPVVSGSRKTHIMKLTYEYKGRNPADMVGPIRLDIDVRFHGPHYNNTKTMEFQMDTSAKITCPVTHYKGIRRSSGTRSTSRHDDEYVTVSISREALTDIAKAQNLNATLGRTQFRFTNEQVAMFKALAIKSKTPAPSDSTDSQAKPSSK